MRLGFRYRDFVSGQLVQAGDVLAGKYRVERLLGAGGMGMVVAARHIQLGERVALKFVLPEMVSNTDVVTRFMREARAAARIKSDHIARVTDVGQLESGAPYMVMEYLDGRDLHAMIAEQGALSIPVAVDMVLQACEALAEAHGYGIVHRDLKPANLFVVARSDATFHVKVLDFGISKPAAADADVSLTRTSTVLGSPAYMSPEQMLRARDVDGRTDIWACGVVLYEALTGTLPFDGLTVPEVCAKIAALPHAPIDQVRLDVPRGLSLVLDKALAKSTTDRFQSVRDLAVALAPYGLPESGLSVRRIEATWRSFNGGATTPSMAPFEPHNSVIPGPPTAHPVSGVEGTQAAVGGNTRPSPRDVVKTDAAVSVADAGKEEGGSALMLSAIAVSVALVIVGGGFLAYKRSARVDTATASALAPDAPVTPPVTPLATPPVTPVAPAAPTAVASAAALPETPAQPSAQAPTNRAVGASSHTPPTRGLPARGWGQSTHTNENQVFDSRK